MFQTKNISSYSPIVFFVLVIPILTELLTANMNVLEVFVPVNYLLLIFFYSIPILIIRELTLRHHLGILGLFLLGLAYGFLNEGVVARTLFLTGDAMFNGAYQIYDIFGVNFPWIFFLVPWHALCAVVYPIVLVGAMYPAQREESWLSMRQMWLLGAIVALCGSILFFNDARFPAISGKYLIFSWLCILVLVFSAFRAQRKHVFLSSTSSTQTWYSFVCGGFFGFWLLGAMMLGGIGAHWFVHIVYACVMFWGLFLLFVRRQWFNLRDASRFAFGHYVCGVFLTISVAGGNPLVMFGELIVLCVLLVIYWKVKQAEVLSPKESVNMSTTH